MLREIYVSKIAVNWSAAIYWMMAAFRSRDILIKAEFHLRRNLASIDVQKRAAFDCSCRIMQKHSSNCCCDGKQKQFKSNTRFQCAQYLSETWKLLNCFQFLNFIFFVFASLFYPFGPIKQVKKLDNCSRVITFHFWIILDFQLHLFCCGRLLWGQYEPFRQDHPDWIFTFRLFSFG